MVAVTASEFRSAHRLNSFPRRFWRLLYVAASLIAVSVPGNADELRPWGAEAVPTLALNQLDGPVVDLAALRGTPVIVHFFATWCAPCVEEMASLNALATRRQGKIIVLAVNVGEVDARVRSFFRERPVSFPVLLDRDRRAMKAWRVEGLPASFVLDRDLRPVLEASAPLDWASPPVMRALNELPQ